MATRKSLRNMGPTEQSTFLAAATAILRMGPNTTTARWKWNCTTHRHRSAQSSPGIQRPQPMLPGLHFSRTAEIFPIPRVPAATSTATATLNGRRQSLSRKMILTGRQRLLPQGAIGQSPGKARLSTVPAATPILRRLPFLQTMAVLGTATHGLIVTVIKTCIFGIMAMTR